MGKETKEETLENKEEVKEENKEEVKEESKEDKNVPLKTFLEVKAKNKEMKAKIEKIEEIEKKRNEDKLLEEKNYKQLIDNKEKEINEYKIKNENYKKNVKIEKIKNKIFNIANKNNAVDGEDVLKFIPINDLIGIEEEKLNENIKKKIDVLKNNKEYLFGSTSKRNKAENGNPYHANISKDSNKKRTNYDEALDLLKELDES